VEKVTPQLAASPGTGTQERMARDTNESAALSPAPVTRAAPEAKERRKTVWMILLVVAVVAGSGLLRRLRTPPGPS
jgi:hypothetical protein